MTTTQTPKEIAAEFVKACQIDDFTVELNDRLDDLVTINARFTPNDTEAYVRCDRMAGVLLGLLPMTYPGTVWGTDGATVGGHAGLTGGYYRLNKSGVSKRVVKAIAKLVKS